MILLLTAIHHQDHYGGAAGSQTENNEVVPPGHWRQGLLRCGHIFAGLHFQQVQYIGPELWELFSVLSVIIKNISYISGEARPGLCDDSDILLVRNHQILRSLQSSMNL